MSLLLFAKNAISSTCNTEEEAAFSPFTIVKCPYVLISHLIEPEINIAKRSVKFHSFDGSNLLGYSALRIQRMISMQLKDPTKVPFLTCPIKALFVVDIR